MGIVHKTRNFVNTFRENGFQAIIVILISRYKLPIPLSAKFKWKAGIQYEIRFWDNWFRTKGLRWPEAYKRKLDPDLPLQPRPAALLPEYAEVCILDVGAGPLTALGKKCEGKRINITAVDPLADKYDRILEKHHVQPIIKTQKLDAESLTKQFPSNTYDLVFASNSIDHAYNPEKAILQMIDVVKNGRFVLLEHALNEGEHENYSGFHQWNFSLSATGDFLISSKSEQVNMTRKYEELCIITCELLNNVTLITRIQKR